MAARQVSVRIVLIVLSVALIVLLVLTTAEFPVAVAPLLALAWLLIATVSPRQSGVTYTHSGSGNPRAPPVLS